MIFELATAVLLYRLLYNPLHNSVDWRERERERKRERERESRCVYWWICVSINLQYYILQYDTHRAISGRGFKD